MKSLFDTCVESLKIDKKEDIEIGESLSYGVLPQTMILIDSILKIPASFEVHQNLIEYFLTMRKGLSDYIRNYFLPFLKVICKIIYMS